MNAEEENEKYNLPCPYNPKVKCVQYPDDSCGCDPCEECEIKLKASEELARKFHETYERLAPDFGYKTREASAKPWEDVPENNKQLMIAVCAEILKEQPCKTPKLRFGSKLHPDCKKKGEAKDGSKVQKTLQRPQ